MAPGDLGLHCGARWRPHGSLATRGPHSFVSEKAEAVSTGGKNIWEKSLDSHHLCALLPGLIRAISPWGHLVFSLWIPEGMCRSGKGMISRAVEEGWLPAQDPTVGLEKSLSKGWLGRRSHKGWCLYTHLELDSGSTNRCLLGKE